MRELITGIEEHWKILWVIVASILWGGRLSWRIKQLENCKDRAPKTMSVDRCLADRTRCSEQLHDEIRVIREQSDRILDYLLNGKDKGQ
jgi:hypothetical protein